MVSGVMSCAEETRDMAGSTVLKGGQTELVFKILTPTLAWWMQPEYYGMI